MTKNFIESEQIKHFDICYYFVYQKNFSDYIQLNYILMNENIVNSLMKLLAIAEALGCRLVAGQPRALSGQKT